MAETNMLLGASPMSARSQADTAMKAQIDALTYTAQPVRLRSRQSRT